MFDATARLKEQPWGALRGVSGEVVWAISRVLAGEAAERVVSQTLRRNRALSADARRAVAEAIFGVGLWRRRLGYMLGRDLTPAPKARPLSRKGEGHYTASPCGTNIPPSPFRERGDLDASDAAGGVRSLEDHRRSG